MIKEFETSVVTSLQSITFPFVNVDDEAIFPIRWNDTISYHVIGKVSDQPCTSITRCLQHFCYYSRGTSSFVSFHLGDSFHHHLNIYMYGRANNRVSSQVLRIPRKLFIQKPLIVLFPSNFLGLVVKREVTRVTLDTFVTNHILVVFSQLFCNFEDVVHPRF